MIIITGNGKYDTNTDAIVLMFSDDTELNQFITSLAQTEVKTSGARVLSIIPFDYKLSEVQKSILNIINGMDGIGGKENDKIIDDSISGLKSLLK